MRSLSRMISDDNPSNFFRRRRSKGFGGTSPRFGITGRNTPQPGGGPPTGVPWSLTVPPPVSSGCVLSFSFGSSSGVSSLDRSSLTMVCLSDNGVEVNSPGISGNKRVNRAFEGSPRRELLSKMRRRILTTSSLRSGCSSDSTCSLLTTMLVRKYLSARRWRIGSIVKISQYNNWIFRTVFPYVPLSCRFHWKPWPRDTPRGWVYM